MPSSHGLWRGTVEIFVTAEVFFNLSECNGRRRLWGLDQWESEFFVSRDDDSKQTLNWSLKKAWPLSTPCCQLTNFMTDWATDGSGVITQGISNTQSAHVQVVMIEGWNIAPPPHRPGILLLLMASNCNFLVFCSVDWRQKYNCCLPRHQPPAQQWLVSHWREAFWTFARTF